ncbi:hypothetical protein RJ640_030455 [Escallonia rubra]|uniref:Protein RALF-like 34 n=1 Tax=Escallonia rubra TaxID=112253 RepID=A0AA88QLV0_9ASTE|nr:hypothetical protein RJ640_030455 [Escallonia rubra]
MASAKLLMQLCFVILLALTCVSRAQLQVEEAGTQLMADALDWPSSLASSLYDEGEDDFDGEVDADGTDGRRALFWRFVRHYISYGALSANRIPCPARSGRSYYTHNCFRARGPANPYTRGCSFITRCRSVGFELLCCLDGIINLMLLDYFMLVYYVKTAFTSIV